MDENGDPNEQFHRNEAISAVADDGFLGEEDDEYDDLYNDVNVGEGFLQSVRKNEELGFQDEEVEKKVELSLAVPPGPPQAVPEIAAAIPGVGGNSGGGEKFIEKYNGGVVEGSQNVGFRVNEMVGRGSGGVGSGPPVGGGLRVELGQSSSKVAELGKQFVNNSMPNQGIPQQPHAPSTGLVANTASVGNVGNDGLMRQGGGNVNGAGGNGFGNGTGPGSGGVGIGIGVGGGIGIGVGGGGGGGGGGTILFVGDLHWWTTDAELEGELCKYGPVKEVKFFDEKASGKSKGYCQVEFYDPASATGCKEGMNGHLFNGRPCVVAYASPFSVKRMGEAQVNRNQQSAQVASSQARRGTGDAPAKPAGNNISTGGNYQGSNDNNRSYGRGNWGRGNNQGMGGRGPGGPLRNRGGGIGGRGMIGNGGNVFGQGIGSTPPLLPPQAMMGQAFDPAFGGHMGQMGQMGQMGRYGGFPGGPTPFSGMMSSFPPVGQVGLPGVAPHVNPAFFNRGMPMNGMGMMPTAGVDGPNMGMWPDPNMAGWAGEEHGGRAAESSYGEEAVSDHQFGEVSHDRGAWPNSMKEKDRGSDRDWSASSDRRYRDDRDPGYDRDIPREKDVGHDHEFPDRRHRDDKDTGRDREKERERERSRDRERGRSRDRERDRHRDDRDRYAEHHRYREREPEYDVEWDRGRSSRTHNKSRLEEEQRSRSRDAEYGKKRRLTSE